MEVNLAGLITAFLISCILLPVIIKFSLKGKLIDIPGKRKIHKKITPSLGGIAIFTGFMISLIIWMPQWTDVKFLLVALFSMFLIGVRDDLVSLKVSIKLIGQFVASAFLIYFFNIRLTGFYGAFEIYEVPIILSYIMTLTTIIIITNSFNLIDGLDGLAGTISSLTLTSFGVWFFLIGDETYSLVAFSMLGAVLAFLIFNWSPSKIFMGDTGALVIGLFLSVVVIHFINVNHLLPENSPFKFGASSATAACFVIIPLIDTARIIILRIYRKQSPLQPDKNHIHHAMVRSGMSHAQAVIILGIVQLVYLGLAILSRNVGESVALVGLVFFSIVLCIFFDRFLLKRRAENAVK